MATIQQQALRKAKTKKTHAKVGRSKSVRGRDSRGGGGVGVESIDVGEEGGHDGRNPRTQVLGRQAMEVSVWEGEQRDRHLVKKCRCLSVGG